MSEYKTVQEMGPQVKRLFFRLLAREAIPPGGGVGDGVEFLQNSDRMKAGHKEALKKLNAFIWLMWTAHDNPYKTDEEFAAALIERLDEGGQQDDV